MTPDSVPRCGSGDHGPHLTEAASYGLCDCGGLWAPGDVLMCDGGRLAHPWCYGKATFQTALTGAAR